MLSPKKKHEVKASASSIFCVQKHDARNLHYDFRIQIGRVLKSWAVPKGPSLNPATKRLAIETTDHSLSYANFHGTIPEGQYGAGKVELWDEGFFINTTEKDDKPISAKKAYDSGHITFELKGKKLKGLFSLIKFRGEKEWLLVKMRDKFASK